MAEILIIEDMSGVRHALSGMLKRAGHSVVVAETGDQGLEHLRRRRFDLVITDMLMPGMDGTEVLFQLGAMPNHPPVIAISGGGAGISAETALKAAKLKADAFLQKPFEKAELLAAVDKVLAK
ncbi:response regulator [Rhodospirillum rubrum]|uniref:Response regulator receiver domain protein (CheY) n=1 Tax=Rhodospirillum rubrum (strain ATCC 11170 / ATH 1.1.1 / DSM 467 / LMG 4362 / NCIMB 8255 / S1) TaxID=269796 RepID=Q2RQP0_RHORT|nr:response regulator [Rhodospirillum rubrum]ABC23555.1 Response regulator receiver domain protein (CheY) [Rhodospirillum rubrum ATCC 11170]AEO49293.1 response regulator receiver domain-containing protein [Rhodospirillum rubrum F11]MBK5955229.1 response regulator [Rhodospirillum rubrum]QXG79521.1 response regulator [Rhodospirillum rubrum]HAP99926.1 response regulator [Rhodospirillum rubrum]